ncbi:hypothetical protein D3C84_1155000 [compost metagenome]
MLAFDGPPAVITQIRVKTARVCRVTSMRLVAMLDLISGKVMNTRRCQPAAPSMRAASEISRGTSARAARYTSMENAVPRQVLARTTATMGKA